MAVKEGTAVTTLIVWSLKAPFYYNMESIPEQHSCFNDFHMLMQNETKIPMDVM